MNSINTSQVLTELSQNRDLHARFLNTISLLEYMGARKIMKSQMADTVSSDILGHISEEIRHAQVFKKLALKVSAENWNGKLDENMNGYREDELLCGELARAYFQGIDQSCHQWVHAHPDSPSDAIATQPARLGSQRINYLLTTLLIEERADELYPFYDEVLSQLGFKSPLGGIIREEKSHLAWVQNELARVISESDLHSLRSNEALLFNAWMSAIQIELDRESHLKRSGTVEVIRTERSG